MLTVYLKRTAKRWVVAAGVLCLGLWVGGDVVKPNQTIEFTASRSHIGNQITVDSPTFTPPSGWKFAEVGEGTYANVSPPSLEGSSVNKSPDSETAVGAEVIYTDPTNAANYRMQLSGRLKPPGGGGGGGGGGEAPTWAAAEIAAPVEVKSITVVDGATQENVEGSDNWAAVKGEGHAIVQVTLEPNTDEAAAQVDWTGGEAVEGKPRQRKVSKAEAAKKTVKAKVGETSAELTVWVVWADISFRWEGQQSAGNAGAPHVDNGRNWGGKKLGLLTDEDDKINAAEVVGKTEIVVTLHPQGINSVIKDGWSIKRWRDTQEFSNGASEGYVSVSDTSGAAFLDLVPDADDKIYDNDGPSCGLNFMVNHEIFPKAVDDDVAIKAAYLGCK